MVACVGGGRVNAGHIGSRAFKRAVGASRGTSAWVRQAWKAIAREAIRIWLGEDRYAAGGSYRAALHQECLRQTPFCVLTERTFRQHHTWTLDAIVGYVLSTSLTSPIALGEKA